MKRRLLGWCTPLVLLGTVLTLGCLRKSTDNQETSEDDPVKLRPGASREEKPANADKAKQADVEALARGNNQFGIDLLRRLGTGKNQFISPASISTAVSMTFCNNDGGVSDKLAKSLHVGFSGERLNTTFAGLKWKLLGEGRPRAHELSIANALWITSSKQFKQSEDFIRKAHDNYAAAPRYVDFAKKEVEPINKWCAEKTKDRIKNILEPTDVDDRTASVLTNAIYFKGDWQYRFKKDKTEKGPFHKAPDSTVQVPLMYQLANLPYHEDSGAQVLEMPYKGDDLSMIVVLPRKQGGLAEVEASLTAERLDGWVKKLKKRKVHVTLPRFKMAGDRLALKETLGQLGMPVGAVPNLGTPPPGMVLYISEIFHKTFVDVNEEGAEAAGVTAVVVKWKDKGGSSDDTVTFRADQPFLFLIRDRHTGCMLFLGRLQEPK